MSSFPLADAALDLRASLKQGAEELGLALTQAQSDGLMAYLQLIQKWNKVYNLTAVREPQAMLTHHVLDSLAVVAPLLRQCPDVKTLLDVGSGAGLPGIVIAICCPFIRVDCVDTVAKKAAFINQVAASLRLSNLKGLHARVEGLTQTYDVVSARAFASLRDLSAWSAAALHPQGYWMAMKGKYPEDEIAKLPIGIQVFHVEQLAVPGLDAERCIVWMKPNLAILQPAQK